MSGNAVYTISKIDDTSWGIEYNTIRALLFTGSDRALLVDSGDGSGDIKGAVESLTSLPVILVNTHADYDHIGGNAQFDRAYMHPSEFARYRQETAGLFKNVNCDFAVSPLWEGDIIDIGSRRFECILIPGHSPGSIALLDEENGILLGGDTVIDDKIALCHEWRDIDAYILSLEKLLGMRSRFDTIYPPHGTFPLDADILEELISGAKRLKNGEIEGVETDFIENARLFDAGVAKFLCK